MFDYFEPGKDYTADSFKIVNQNYLFVCKKKKGFRKEIHIWKLSFVFSKEN